MKTQAFIKIVTVPSFITIGILCIILIVSTNRSIPKETWNELVTMLETANKDQAYKAKAIRLAYPSISSDFEAEMCIAMFSRLTATDTLIDWYVIAALIHVESNYNSTALESRTRASGWMQLKPATAEIQAKKLSIRFHKNRTIWNELLNVELGYSYLRTGIYQSTSTNKEQRIKDGLTAYVAGLNYKKANIKNPKTLSYMNWYMTKVYSEIQKLKYLYLGLKND